MIVPELGLEIPRLQIHHQIQLEPMKDFFVYFSLIHKPAKDWNVIELLSLGACLVIFCQLNFDSITAIQTKFKLRKNFHPTEFSNLFSKTLFHHHQSQTLRRFVNLALGAMIDMDTST